MHLLLVTAALAHRLRLVGATTDALTAGQHQSRLPFNKRLPRIRVEYDLVLSDFSWTSEDRKARSGWKQGMFTLPEGLNQGSALTPTDTTLGVSPTVDNKRRQLGTRPPA